MKILKLLLLLFVYPQKVCEASNAACDSYELDNILKGVK